jgi:hypothetical protein
MLSGSFTLTPRRLPLMFGRIQVGQELIDVLERGDLLCSDVIVGLALGRFAAFEPMPGGAVRAGKGRRISAGTQLFNASSIGLSFFRDVPEERAQAGTRRSKVPLRRLQQHLDGVGPRSRDLDRRFFGEVPKKGAASNSSQPVVQAKCRERDASATRSNPEESRQKSMGPE